MKHLKPFNENIKPEFTQENLDDIRDVFQDLIDEYDIEINSTETDDDLSVTYNIIYTKLNKMRVYYNLLVAIDFTKIKLITIRIYLPISAITYTYTKYKREDEILKDTQDFNKRLNLMGYNTALRVNKEAHNIEYIDIDIPININEI